jgi:hypothetical protein
MGIAYDGTMGATRRHWQLDSLDGHALRRHGVTHVLSWPTIF